MIVENGKEGLKTPNYVGKLGSDDSLDWEIVGRNGTVAGPGDAVLIAGKYLIDFPVKAATAELQSQCKVVNPEPAVAE